MLEDLTDCVENDVYIGAIRNDNKPSKAWSRPTNAERKNFLSQLALSSPNRLSIVNICSDSLGFYLVSYI